MRKRGFIIRRMGEDGACLFRAVADQVYGDQEMHSTVRRHCMDYIVSCLSRSMCCWPAKKTSDLFLTLSESIQAANGDYFSQYMTEDFTAYVSRKRLENVHGNHIEMQAMSEMYNRPIEVFCYSIGTLMAYYCNRQCDRINSQLLIRYFTSRRLVKSLLLLKILFLMIAEPINIFHGAHQTDNEPIRLSYHRGVHYNSLVDPFKATVGVGLGLPGFVPGLADKKLVCDALQQSEETHIEQTMLEDKMKATDWEATSEAIEEQVARESYLDWLRENERRTRQQRSTSATCSADLRSPRTSTSSSARNSPKPASFIEPQRRSPNASPKASGSKESTSAASPVSSPAAGTSTSAYNSKQDWGLGPGFELAETASFLGQLPPDMFGEFIIV